MKNAVYLDTNEAEIIRGMVYTILFEHGCEVSTQYLYCLYELFFKLDTGEDDYSSLTRDHFEITI
ncbi:hypothetical protein SKQ_01617 [Enterococcus faecium EnGen0171]|nr:hypothetical protein SKQ_01617 [Enterococcus faecium EnGen0171]EOM39374.1 hypothetical protein SKS_01209 [Enterococcus faecium EnGen0172]ROY16694.1 hypothetical protein EGW55_04070 [Enterococcus faecium]